MQLSITIPANGLIKLDVGKDNLGNQVFEGFNNLNVFATSAGDYRVYAVLMNNNLILRDLENKTLETGWEFNVTAS